MTNASEETTKGLTVAKLKSIDNYPEDQNTKVNGVTWFKEDGTKQKFGEILIQHEVRVLMTRGVNGMYIYACDPELQKALLEAAK